MQVKVYDTHVRTRDGRYLHFDVLVRGDDGSRAPAYAMDWLEAQGIQAQDVQQSRCDFCHSESASPPVEEAFRAQGYAIIPLQGC
ncbi:DUF2024 family protein [Pseudomonas schmalbachii]|uniref:DUF2024 family protein n=1 Tax=Pseudomonas schmalbachii TaxID=2816993 RepID=A0ABS3TS36_9PSED|nr:DUF2024 family protein [Pseudomonas schmalbachii]MBO3276475.1 DUF2024 family protein [Pseudomonas schmalbachii]